MGELSKLKTMANIEIQNWLRKVDDSGRVSLVYALLVADDEVKNRIYMNMSERGVIALKEEINKYNEMDIADSIIQEHIKKLEKLL